MRLRWSDPAKQDLAAIDDFYAEQAPRFAERAIREAVAAARFLLRFPEAGRIAGSGQQRAWHVRRTPYVLTYQIEEDGVSILRVRHERQDETTS